MVVCKLAHHSQKVTHLSFYTLGSFSLFVNNVKCKIREKCRNKIRMHSICVSVRLIEGQNLISIRVSEIVDYEQIGIVSK